MENRIRDFLDRIFLDIRKYKDIHRNTRKKHGAPGLGGRGVGRAGGGEEGARGLDSGER